MKKISEFLMCLRFNILARFLYLTSYIVKTFFTLFTINHKKDFWDSKLWSHGGAFYIKSDLRLHFVPQCYIQRYLAVTNLLEEEGKESSIKKVVDFGCAELGLFQFLKKVEGIQEYVGVDIDEELLERCSCRAEPLMSDFLFDRKFPLSAKTFAGSATEYDECLKNADIVIAIELIEHLYDDVLQQLLTNVFNNIQPRLAIFTTPNSEFNVLFSDFSGMRHPDHKFEWTRKQFENWAVGIIKRYPDYTVKLYGICPPPPEFNVGCCSQMAVFRREHDLSSKTSTSKVTNTYKSVREYEYLYAIDNRTENDKIVDEIRYRFYLVATTYSIKEGRDADDYDVEVPLELFLPYVSDFCPTLCKLREVLETEGWKIGGTKEVPLISLPEDYIESDSSDWKSDSVSNAEIVGGSVEEHWTDDSNELFEPSHNCSVILNEELKTHCDDISHKEENGCIKKVATANSFNNDCKKNRQKRGWEHVDDDEEKGEWVSLSNNRESTTPRDEHIWFNDSQRIPSERSWGQVASVEVARYESDESEEEMGAASWRTPRGSHTLRRQKGISRLAKSFSLDSCLENINCERAEVQAMYLSMHSRARTIESGSPSERGPDSGYPISFSQDLSEQPDLATSDDSLSEGDDVPPRRPRLPNPLPPVENGDVANNNRDGEGNNVEGVRNPLPPPFLHQEFPPWLLQLLMEPPPLPPPPHPHDEGLGEDSGSELSDSPAASIE